VNYFKRHLGDYAKDTRHLSTYQHGVYALLLDWYYSNERAIPMDIVYRIVQARTGPERASVDQVLTSFFDMSKEPGFAHSKRANEDIAKYKSKAATNRLNRNGTGGTDGQRIVEEVEDESSTNGEPSHKPLASSHKEETKAPALKRASTPKVDLQTFLAACTEAGELPIPADDSIYAYAESIGLPDEYLALAWGWFKANRAGAKQAGVNGWRAHFRDAVRGNWPKLWYAAKEGGWALTTAGEQARRAAA
jgi:uncharacterized protein YdaU (DUF1376 family)